MNKNRWQFAIIFCVFGMLIGTTNLFAPLHEAAHVMSAAKDGISAEVTGWASSTIHGVDFKAMMAGWKWELIWSLVIALILSFIGRKSKAAWFTGGGALGYGIVTWIRAFNSVDFNDGMRSMVNNSLIDKTMLNQVWEEVHHSINTNWAVMGVISLTICISVVIFNSLKEGKSVKRNATIA
jgi:hypothetical protein